MVIVVAGYIVITANLTTSLKPPISGFGSVKARNYYLLGNILNKQCAGNVKNCIEVSH
jgi:hypothetical protein